MPRISRSPPTWAGSLPLHSGNNADILYHRVSSGCSFSPAANTSDGGIRIDFAYPIDWARAISIRPRDGNKQNGFLVPLVAHWNRKR